MRLAPLVARKADGRDGVALVGYAVVGAALAERAGVDDARQGRQQAGDREDRYLYPHHGHARDARGPLVAADGVDVAGERRLVQDKDRDRADDQEDQGRYRDEPVKDALAQDRERLGRLLPAVAVLAYLAADLASGFVHFLADNFGSEKTPFLGPNFIGPFRDHHVDPTGITRNDFVDNNGNNCLASLPLMLPVWLFAPVATTAWGYVPVSATILGYLFGAFFLIVCLAVFLTNQFHKWAHMDAPPAWVKRLQTWNLILSKEHHDVHHESPYDTYYCITVGVWNPLLDRLRFFERAERLARRIVPGTDPLLRSERDGSLNG